MFLLFTREKLVLLRHQYQLAARALYRGHIHTNIPLFRQKMFWADPKKASEDLKLVNARLTSVIFPRF